jgi:aspartate carbamoyltransferase catalytic subunit
MVGPEMMRQAKPDALFMHCLLAHRGEEVAAEVIDGPQASSGTKPRTGCTRRRRCSSISSADA